MRVEIRKIDRVEELLNLTGAPRGLLARALVHEALPLPHRRAAIQPQHGGRPALLPQAGLQDVQQPGDRHLLKLSKAWWSARR